MGVLKKQQISFLKMLQPLHSLVSPGLTIYRMTLETQECVVASHYYNSLQFLKSRKRLCNFEISTKSSSIFFYERN